MKTPILSQIPIVTLCASLLVVANTAKAIELQLIPKAPDALIVEGASTAVEIVINPTEGESGQFQVRPLFVDRYGKETQGEPISVNLNGEWRQEVDVPVEYYGAAQLRVGVHKAGSDEAVATGRIWLVKPVPVPQLTDAERRASPMGINVHHQAHWDTLAAFGVHWARDYHWSWLRHGTHIPISENKTNFGSVLERATAAGIEILPVMQGSFRTEDKKAFIDDGQLIQQSYERLSRGFPDIVYWELDNESALQHRDESSEAYKTYIKSYVNYIRNAHKGLQAADTGAKVALDGEAGIHPERLKFLLEEAGDSFAVVNYHYYTGNRAPELAERDINTGSEDRAQTMTFLDLMRAMNRLAKEHGKETWLSEIAWSAEGGPEVGHRLQAAYLHRIYLLGAWAGTDKTHWFWDRNMGGQGRFSGTGLIDMEAKPSVALPAGAAMAAVSKFIARADYSGSVDIGDGRWCLVFKRPEGGWVAAAWAVGSEHPLPEPLAEISDAFDMYGNPLQDRQLSDEPAYFYMKALPAAWEGQREIEWLSPYLVNTRPGGDFELELAGASGITIALEGFPAGVEASDWSHSDGKWTSTLRALPTVELGTHSGHVVVNGEGWTKRFPVALRLSPAVEVHTLPYTAGASSDIEARLLIPGSIEASFEIEDAHGSTSPGKLSLKERETQTVTFDASEGASGPLKFMVTLDNGAKQTEWIRPKFLSVPRASNITIDGQLNDWPEGGLLPVEALLVEGPDSADFAPEMRLAWTPEGLYVASRIPVGEGARPPAKPQDFWEWTSMEMNMNASNDMRVVNSHLLFFVPTRDSEDGPWRVFAGQWNKKMPDGETKSIFDDERTQHAMTYEEGTMTMEVFIPNDVLGDAPQAGHKWPLTISSKISIALSPRTNAAWPAGPGSGWEAWGRIVFEE